MKTIVAVDKNWGIGKKNDLLFSLPEDMAFFRRTTLNKVCCMGYNTLLSFPGSKPLKNRTSIVLAPEGLRFHRQDHRQDLPPLRYLPHRHGCGRRYRCAYEL